MYVLKSAIAATLLLILAACNPTITIQSETKVIHTPSRSQERFPRHETVFACTTIAALYEYIDYGVVSAGCGYVKMTAARYRSVYENHRGQRYNIVEFERDFTKLFTFEETRRSRYYYGF